MSPSVSTQQKTLSCIALAIKTGKLPTSYSKQGAKMAASMSEAELNTYCKEPVKK
jgi:hypothetical protein